MPSDYEDYITRKLKQVEKDFETAYASYERHESNIMSLRGWSITLVVAYLGLFASIGRAQNFLFVLPGILAIAGFLFLDVIEQVYRTLNFLNIQEIEELFMLEEKAEFESRLRSYEFRNLQLKKLNFNTKASLFLALLKGEQLIVWYSFLLLSLLAIFSIILLI